MGNFLPVDPVDALLVIHHAAPSKRSSLVNDFIGMQWRQYERLAVQLCHQSGRDPFTYADDVVSLVTEQAVTLINDLVKGGPVEIQTHGGNLIYLLRKSTKNAVQQFFYSEAGGAALSGLDNVIRRSNQIKKTRRDFLARELREPTDAEVIEETNARLMENRKDAKRSGLLVTEADLKTVVSEAFVPHSEYTADGLGHTEEYVLHPIEGRQIVVDTVAAAYEVSHDLGSVAELWIGDFYPDGVGLAKQVEIMEATGLSKQQVSRSIGKIKKIAQGLLESKLTEEDFANLI